MITITVKSRSFCGKFDAKLKKMHNVGNHEKTNKVFPIEIESHIENSAFVLNDADLYFKRPPIQLKRIGNAKINHSRDTFHQAIKPILLVGQCFGIMPVVGILGENYKKLKFSWLNWRVFYNLFCITGAVVMTGFSCYNTYKSESGLREIRDIIFYGSNFISLCLFLKIAPKWPEIAKAMAECELNCKITDLQNYRSKNGKTLSTKLAICCAVVLGLALMEHLFSILAGIAVSIDCPYDNRPPVEAYFSLSFRQVFSAVDFSIWLAAYLQFTNIAMTITWNFMDLFLIVISVALIDRFAKFNKYLFRYIGEAMPENFWRNVREEFSNLAQLVRTIDDVINEIILLSFANNLYFICVQLFNSLNESEPEEDDKPKCGRSKNGPLFGYSSGIYFGFSFTFLLVRSLAVCLAAAGLHSEACKPNTVLYSVPSSSYCIEVQRFLEQVTTDVVAFTGSNFFHITRGLILTIAGTIVTYELVLLQFNAAPPSIDANITLNDTCGIAAPPTVSVFYV